MVLLDPQGDEKFFDEPGSVAYSLSRGEGFANPYGGPTGPTAHVAPFTPLLLALFIKVFGGNTDTAWLASRLVACAIISLHAALLPLIAERAGIGRRAGVVAGALAAIPLFLWLETNGRFETPYVVLATTLLVSLTAVWLDPKHSRRDTRDWALLGLGWGVGVLLTPTLLPVLLALLVVGALPSLSAGRRLTITHGVAALVGAMLVFVPYSVERSLALRAPLLVRSNFGLELFISNNDAAHPRFLDNMADSAVMHRYHPLLRRSEAIKVMNMGEGAYHAMLRRQAVDWIADHPGAFLRLTSARFVQFWLPTANHPVKTVFLALLTVFGIGWFGRHVRRGDPHVVAARLWLTAIVAFSLLHYAIQADIRYRYPVQGLFLLAAGAGLVDFARRLRPARAQAR
ncbi:MAG TPA: glycosyltransferase family 39 protein [Gemmatimonadaceae bacterium]|nr:glycosyltransferase family 39 protein [Gemmatimonadaceae bacterium]